MTALPRGTVTLVFVDVEGSTAALRQLGSDYGDALALYRALLREAITHHTGVEVDTQGDGVFAAYASVGDALRSAHDVQRALADASWPSGLTLKARMGIHTGEPELRETGYVGLDVHRAARICSAAHGGQVVVSSVTRALAGKDASLRFVDLGRHRLRGLDDERLFQLVTSDADIAFPPLRTSTASNLPELRGPTIGREAELAELDGLLRSGARLVTLIGPGGAGKSRLAIEAARALVGEPAHGVHLVRLATLDDPALLESEIVRSLGAGSPDGRPAPTVHECLSDRELLLVLDNFEHLAAAAPVVGELVERARGVTVLCTSRSPLRLTHERVMLVDPLAEDDAVELFVERARTADSRFRLADEDRPALRRLCRELDGLPLAIEIAAAHVGALTVHDLASQVRTWLRAEGARDLPSRQRTLSATLAWSYDLLSAAERSLHGRLAIFQGRFTPQAALAGFGGTIGELGALVSSALLRRADDGRETGLVMLRTVRELALARLTPEELARARRERDTWLDDLVARASVELTGPDPARWLLELEAWLPDLRASLDDSRRAGEHERVIRLVNSLGRFWGGRLHVDEARNALEAALAAAPPGDLRLHAEALWRSARLAIAQGDDLAAVRPLTGALELFRALGAEREVSFALTELAWLSLDRGALADAAAQAEEALGNARAAHDERAEASALNALASLATERAEPAQARALALQSLEIRRRIGDRLLIADAALTAGAAALADGDLDGAEDVLRECLELARAVGDAPHEAGALCCLGETAVLRGEVDEARNPLLTALGVFVRLGNEPAAAECLVALALTEEPDRGARLLGAAVAARTRASAVALPVERVLESMARSRLGTLESAVRAGASLSVVDAALLAGVEPDAI